MALPRGLRRERIRTNDSETFAGLRMQIDHVEGSSSSDSQWPHMDERLMQLRGFYGGL
jgi:hypothetical protein